MADLLRANGMSDNELAKLGHPAGITGSVMLDGRAAARPTP
ncbi:MAG: hypothetical protein JWR78_4935 [Mycobacterium sp.]|nr:hypothetical protein [Mycobacterium sp.]